MAAFTKAQLKEYFELQEEIERLTAKFEKMKLNFKTKLPVGEWEVDGLDVKVYDRAGQVDNGKVLLLYPPEERPELYTLQPDNALVKQHLSAEQIAKARKDPSRIVQVKKAKGE